MSRYSTQPRNESNLEASITDDFRKASVRNFGPFEFLASGSTAIFEGAGGWL